MENFTLISVYAGGLLIGAAATILFLFNGRIAGISGMLNGLINNSFSERAWRLAFLGGIVLGAYWYHQLSPVLFRPRENFPMVLLILAGFLVGFGTRMGNGCTSGHVVCGIARLSNRSVAATLIFMTSAFITVFVVRHVFGVK